MLTSPQNPGTSSPVSALDRLNATRVRIAQSASQYGRMPDEIQLLAVSKAQPVSAMRELAMFGQQAFGESYVQEAVPKMDALTDLKLSWHFIGQIQGNKTAVIAERFDWVHTVDRERIARRLNEQRPHYAGALNVCIQVKLVEEPGKGGICVDALPDLVQRFGEMPKLRLRGLMCIPPAYEQFDEQRAAFAQLHEQWLRLRARGIPLDTLSMGMSADLEAAIAAGATMVRVGTALFGPRAPHLDSETSDA
jgi:PLP dependent protein